MWLSVLVPVVFFYSIIRWYRWKQTLTRYPSKYVFITGCDTGFGNALARRLDQRQFHVFAGCLTESGAAELSKDSTDITTVVMDITKLEDIEKAYNLVKETIPSQEGLWGLVNNAGILNKLAPFEWLPRAEFFKCIDVNLCGTIDVTRQFLPLLRRTPGRIINVTSVAGLGPTPTSISYAVSKRGIAAFSESLRSELYKTGVTVHIIRPGGFSTGIMNIASQLRYFQEMYENLNPELREYYGPSYKEGMEKRYFPGLNYMTPGSKHKVVDSMVHALTARYPRPLYVVGYDANTLYKFLQFAPEWLVDFLLNLTVPKPEGSKSLS